MKTRKNGSFATFAALICGFSASLSHAEDCYRALIQDAANVNLHDVSHLAALRLIQKHSSSDHSLGLGFEGVISGSPSKVKGSKLDSYVNDYFSKSTLNWDEDHLASVATQTLGSGAVEAYKVCMKQLKDTGPRITIFNAMPGEVTVKIQWVSGVNAPTTTNHVLIEKSGGTWKHPWPRTWKNQQEEYRILMRDPNKDLRISVNIGNKGDEYLLAAMPLQEAPKENVIEIASCHGQGGLINQVFWGPTGYDCNGIAGWGIYKDDPQTVKALSSCVGYGGLTDFWMYGPDGQKCAGTEGWKYYTHPVELTDGIGRCIGHGSKVGGMVFWGPKNHACAGHLVFGRYE